ncbi:hypothetical protein [Reichenbachiella sp.]|uniref:hypothetical protein n=2 Tax=Reichenbachiella sp. TaxID=2184521 RepID=UPI003296ABE9
MMNHVTPKYAGMFIILLLSSYFVYIKKYKHAAIILCSIQVLTFMMTPVVLWGTSIGSLVLRIFKKISARDLLQIVSFALFTTVSTFAFYSLTPIPTEYQGLAVNYSEVFNGLLNNFPSTIKKILGTHFYYLLDYLIFVLPSLIILYFNRKKFNKLNDIIDPIIFIFILFEGGIVSTWLLYDYHGEGWQPQYYTLCVGSIVLIVWSYLTLSSVNKNHSRYFLLIMIIVCLINLGNTFTNHRITNDKRFAKYDVSKLFFNEAKNIFSNKGKVAVGFLETDPISPLVYPMGNILLHINSQINLECIDLSIINSDNGNYKICSFSEYVKKHRYDNDIQKMQLEFIEQNNIEYFIGYGALDKESALYLNSEEILRDSLSSLYIRKISPQRLQVIQRNLHQFSL